MRAIYRLTALALTLFIVCAFTVHAEQATVTEMRNVCENHLNYMLSQKGIWAGDTAPTIETTQPIYENDRLVGYCYTISPSGWVIVPTLKALDPIKASSETGTIDMTEPGGMAALLREDLYDALTAYENLYGDISVPLPDTGEEIFLRSSKTNWDRYEISPKLFTAAMATATADTLFEIGPLVTAHWNQSDPYNMYCPAGDGGTCVVGCVATAVAMILDYHEWPPFGIDTTYYWWTGDESCGGSTPMEQLKVDLSDTYDWANIPDKVAYYSPDSVKAATAELNYEVGVAYEMQYGVCGSGSYVTMGTWVLPDRFRYKDSIHTYSRPGWLKEEWFNFALTDIERGLPISYRITSHAIILDGCRIVDGIMQFHFNYGWDNSRTTWYTIDANYCPWSECAVSDHLMLTNIMPDREVMYMADTTVGMAPLTVNFSGSSDLDNVDSWTYDFGDGDSAFVQSPTHIYDESGNYTVSLTVTQGDYSRSIVRNRLIFAIGDTLIAPEVLVERDSVAEITISARNTAPLNELKIPINFGGTLDLTLDSFSVAGCRTDFFEIVQQTNFDGDSLTTIRLQNTTSGTGQELDPGYGPILKLWFTPKIGARIGQTAHIDLNGYGSREPWFYGSKMDYQPEVVSGNVTCWSCCVGIRGNVDMDENNEISISDLIYLVSYMFDNGPEPECTLEADVNASDAIDIADLVYLVTYMFQSGDIPSLCP
ncbi:MAG TPA: C10 family peptidase [candidate division Zixibacteria bacterium]|nr:C10 family peptidase [candidate division Zixibacteria bacterium]